MDPITFAGGFANIVGLIADFAASRGQRDVLEMKDFLEWLRFHGFEELRGKIEASTAVTVGVKAALAEGKDELLVKLAAIEQLLTALTVGQGSLHTLALAVSPNTALSPQAKDILMAFEDAAAGKALLHESFEGSHLLMLDGEKSSSFSPTEQRFFDADLSELLGLQLFEAEFNKKGNRLFQLTRRGAAVGRALIDARGGVAPK